MPSAKTVRALGSFACTVDGEEYFVHEGEVLPATIPR